MPGPGAQPEMLFSAKAGWWDWRMRIGVAIKRHTQYVCPSQILSRPGFVRAVPQQTVGAFQEGFSLPCFASPFGACETVYLFLKTCAVQTVQAVRAEELWP